MPDFPHYTLDPNIAFENIPSSALLEICGFLPQWIFQSHPALSMRECLNQNYAFAGGFQPFDGPSLDEKNRWCYPGDPPLDPLIIIESNGDVFRQYQYGLVALTTNGVTEFARLD